MSFVSLMSFVIFVFDMSVIVFAFALENSC